MRLQKEISFEVEKCQCLSQYGWLYAEGLAKNHGSKTDETLLTRLRDQIDQRGALDVLICVNSWAA